MILLFNLNTIIDSCLIKGNINWMYSQCSWPRDKAYSSLVPLCCFMLYSSLLRIVSKRIQRRKCHCNIKSKPGAFFLSFWQVNYLLLLLKGYPTYKMSTLFDKSDTMRVSKRALKLIQQYKKFLLIYYVKKFHVW